MCHLIAFKFYMCITFINLFPKFENGFCPMNADLDDCSYGQRLSVSTSARFNLIICHLISSKFHIICITLINLSPKIENGFYLMTAEKNGLQNGCHLSNSPCRRYNLVVCHEIASIFYIVCFTLINLSSKIENGFCLIKSNMDGHLSDFTYALQLLSLHLTKFDFKLY